MVVDRNAEQQKIEEVIAAIEQEYPDLIDGRLSTQELRQTITKPIIGAYTVIGHEPSGPSNSFQNDPNKFQIGEGSIWDSFGHITTKVKIGRMTHLSRYVDLGGGVEHQIVLGDGCGVAVQTCIYTASDTIGDPFTIAPRSFHIKKGLHGDVILDNHVGVGALSFVMPRNHILEGDFITALSVVPYDFQGFEPWCIYGGVGKNFHKIRNYRPEEVESELRKYECMEHLLNIAKQLKGE